MRMKVSNYIAKLLVQNGITDVFMITGGGAMHLDDGLGHEPGLHCVYHYLKQKYFLLVYQFRERFQHGF